MMYTKDRLTKALREVASKARKGNAEKYEALAKRAATGEFDDYASVHICGPTALYQELCSYGFTKFASRVAAGEFDATLEESEEWVRSITDLETINLMKGMGIWPDRSRDQ